MFLQLIVRLPIVRTLILMCIMLLTYSYLSLYSFQHGAILLSICCCLYDVDDDVEWYISFHTKFFTLILYLNTSGCAGLQAQLPIIYLIEPMSY